jgi:glycosyltransferase involved in cell wall biosynthesis
MLLSSLRIDAWLGVDGNEPNLLPICCLFLFCTFILNTADVVVDSWALTMLRRWASLLLMLIFIAFCNNYWHSYFRENVGYQATCDLIGSRVGHFLGYILFMLLRSEEFSGYLGQTKPILTFSGKIRLSDTCGFLSFQHSYMSDFCAWYYYWMNSMASKNTYFRGFSNFQRYLRF